ncbi:helix-hairpin-helix domain-containing protein [uncultured Deinococcus sp.]|uniref:ComEA family DNA-binding protein n=1 Tax=uncultured Deinococcus sp. TaxID=158789 RepID=UPI0025838A7F|nr:helix-hairpin-helix domain-containing protein [uncultured Deinococcus sp.]
MNKSLLSALALSLLLPVSAFAATAKPAAPAPMPAQSATTPMPGAAKPGMSMPAMRKVRINTAAAAELTTIPGVSTKFAAEIIKARPFRNSADLVKKVKGIGTNNVKKMLPMIDFS